MFSLLLKKRKCSQVHIKISKNENTVPLSNRRELIFCAELSVWRNEYKRLHFCPTKFSCFLAIKYQFTDTLKNRVCYEKLNLNAKKLRFCAKVKCID